MVKFEDEESCGSLSLDELRRMDKSSFDFPIEEEEEEEGMEEVQPRLATKETRTVMVLRALFAVVLLGVAIGVTVTVLLYSRGNEKEDFERAFADNGRKIVDQ